MYNVNIWSNHSEKKKLSARISIFHEEKVFQSSRKIDSEPIKVKTTENDDWSFQMIVHFGLLSSDKNFFDEEETSKQQKRGLQSPGVAYFFIPICAY